MANTFVASRAHIIWGVCLPLAILVGYLLADPVDQGSLAVLVLLAAVLSVPLKVCVPASAPTKVYGVGLRTAWPSLLVSVTVPV